MSIALKVLLALLWLIAALLSPFVVAAQTVRPMTAEAVRLYDAKDFAGARAKLETATKADTKDAVAAYYMGRLELDENHADKAGEWFDRAVELDPKNALYYLYQGRAYGSQAQKANVFTKARLARRTKNAWDKAEQLDPNNLDIREDLIQFYIQAPGIMGGSTEKAYAEANEIKKRDATRGLLSLGMLYERDKKGPEAEAVYKQLREVNPRFGTSRLSAYYALNKQFDKAWEVVDAAAKADPKTPLFHFLIGRIASLSGQQLDRGEQALQSYMKMELAKDDPTVANAHWRLGTIYEAKKDVPRARAEYQVALQLNPKLKEAQASLDKLR